MEDFGFGGDEFLIGDCTDDHFNMDVLDARADEYEEREQILREMAEEADELIKSESAEEIDYVDPQEDDIDYRDCDLF